MRIGMVIPTPEKRPTGVNNVMLGLINEIKKLENSYFEFFYIGSAYNIISDEKHICQMIDDNNSDVYDFYSYIHSLDIIHSLNAPLVDLKTKSKKVITIHDINPVIYPDFYKGSDLTSAYMGPFKESVEQADLVITVSNDAKKNVIEYYNIKPEKIVTVYNGLNIKTLDSRQEYYIDGDYILSVSTMAPHKNMQGVIDAFILFRERHVDSNLKLVLCGRTGWNGALDWKYANSKYVKDIIFTGYVTDGQLAYLYKNAKCFLLMSFCEGFGLPLLEAMSFGIPTITSNLSSLPEVAGDASILCSPYSVEEIQDAIALVMSKEDLRTQMGMKSLEQSKKFTYKQNLYDTLNAYKMVCEL